MFDWLLPIDRAVFDWIETYLASPVLDACMIFLTYLCYGLWVLVGAVFLIRKKTRRQGCAALFSLGLMVVCNNFILKNLICRPRPFVSDPSLRLKIPAPGGYSVPSGHASSSSCGALSFSGKKRWFSVLLFSLALLISFSRVYLHVHYFSDVFFGFLLGLFYSKFGSFLFARLVADTGWGRRFFGEKQGL